MNDSISRQSAIDALRKMQTYKLLSGDDMLLINQEAAMTELMSLPSAEPEQREKGHWIEDGGYQICSNCGEEHFWQDYRANFCETCGADMRQREVTE